ncbi:hypothetical protein ONZ43_g992 [Nemania bipapillata]|uniref:Uncharacterized protein n=1 Tax=Nemania bipapillata TaxID=110536 RepID=A0ACC2J6J2_9PEZI|nr:hypothetical protein ONZ43_g992 [Nemania bipapillata]
MDTTERLAQRYRQFVQYVEGNSEHGVDGKNEEKPYISREKLAEHLDGDKILSLLSNNDRQVNLQTISTTLLQTFAILVWISRSHHNWTDYIRCFISANFTDSRLPLAPPPQQGERSRYRHEGCPFPDNPEGLDAWQQFSEQQWRFIPLQFRHSNGSPIERVHEGGNDVDVRQIRPITILEQLHPEYFGSAKIYKVQPHKSSGLPEKYGNDPIILKEYPFDELAGQFDQEHTAYMTISNNMHDMQDHRDAHFLRYYGAFQQGDKLVLLLEYCREGTLLDLFERCWYLPRKIKEARVLMEAALHLLEGLDFLHSKGENSLIVHQDIKPANIFVFTDHQPGKPDKLLFKLGDFGMSSTSDPSARGEAEGPGYQASRIYSAPEIPAWTESDQDISRMTSWHSDIWSFGCVMYELAVWMATFERGRDAGYRGAFHDGKEVLQIVQDEVDKMKNHRAGLKKELCRHRLAIFTATYGIASATDCNSNDARFGTQITLNANADLRLQKWPQKSKKQRDPAKLSGMGTALRDLEDRDQCFIIDNSSSMTYHWEEVKKTALALASIVQDIDPDEFEVFCTNTRPRLKTKSCKKLERYLNESQPFNAIGHCRMETQLDNILPELVTNATKQRNPWDHIRRKQRTRGINVYVLTNGVWENGDSEIPEATARSIKTIIDNVKGQGRGRTFLSIQFVRFGESSIGKRRLQWLDDDLKYQTSDQWDIVDTTPHTGSVWKMLIGATSAFEDNIVEEGEEGDPFTSKRIQQA